MLEIRNLSLRIGVRRILRAVSLDVPRLGVHALMGPGGAGKSTLLRVVTAQVPEGGLWTVTGSVLLDGVPVAEAPQPPRLLAQRLAHPLVSVFDVLRRSIPEREQLTRPEQRDRVVSWLEQRRLGLLVGRLDMPLLACTEVEARLVHLSAALLSEPALLCVDEILAGVEEENGTPVEELLADAGERGAVLLVSHHQRRVRRLASSVALLAGGELLVQDSSPEFFVRPGSELQASYVRTGGLPWPPEDREGEPADGGGDAASTAGDGEEASVVPAADVASALLFGGGEAPELPFGEPVHPPRPDAFGRGPDGFVWLTHGELAGCPQPGLFAPIEADFDRLCAAGISVLVTLTEDALAGAPLDRFGVHGVHFPVPDMHAPEPEAALALCRSVERWLMQGHRAAYHCKAGIGRTGTMLVLHLIGRGTPMDQALVDARRQRSDWVQSSVQLEFLRSMPVGFLLG